MLADFRASFGPAPKGSTTESTTGFLFLPDMIHYHAHRATVLPAISSLGHVIPADKTGAPKTLPGAEGLCSELTFLVWAPDGTSDHTGCDPGTKIGPSRGGSFPAGMLKITSRTLTPALGTHSVIHTPCQTRWITG